MAYDLSYFLRYYGRYFPSRARLYEKIDTKVENADVREAIKEQIDPYIVEHQILEDRVANLVRSGKNRFYIISNLRAKGFLHDDIVDMLVQNEEAGDSDLLRSIYEPKIQHWIAQKKSRTQILQKLRSCVDDISCLEESLSDLYTSEVECEIVAGLVAGNARAGIERQKCFERLARKGFSYDSIRSSIEDIYRT